MSEQPIIRRRQARTMRRRDGLIRFAKDKTSQNGEDGIIQRLFELLPKIGWCVDVGAWDGKHLSNTYSLLLDQPLEDRWQGVLIEADATRFQQLKQLHDPLNNTTVCCEVSCMEAHPNTLVNILKSRSNLPSKFDLLCIDIDGSDYWVLEGLLKEGSYQPSVVCIEFNPSMPDDLVYIPVRDDTIRHGASLSALVELANSFDYVLVETTIYNAFFVQKKLFDKYLRDEVPDTSIEALHETTMGTTLYQLYDGSLKLWGCKKLLWHRISIDEKKIQVIQPEDRVFPFAPDESDLAFDTESVVDMSSYSKDGVEKSRKRCSSHLIRHLLQDGFCLVRGLGLSRELCTDALNCTNAFLHEAHENVRRSCLAQDRARRGYSPMNVENFASLIGERAPNDLVRKFRVGPLHEAVEESALLQPNVWPTSEVWDPEQAPSFRTTIEKYYETASRAGQKLVEAICDGMTALHPEREQALKPMRNYNSHTSILTLLGYQVGSRHRGKKKGPLVAAHTDVGVFTLLIFDGGNNAGLQRRDTNGDWIDVRLPHSVPNDPIFVVNIADCLSEVCAGQLPSALHRVVAKKGTVPRNCCALFVGLNPDALLEVDGESISYEEWRKRRIARSQEIVRMNARQKYSQLQHRFG